MSAVLDDLLEQSNDTISALLEDGADPDEYYEIEHHLASRDFTKLEKAAVELVKQGYHVDDADEFDEEGDRWFSFAAITEVKLAAEVLARQVREIDQIADECGVEYDGWGTYLDDEEDDSDEDY
ncbi:ribonuclease E inhibitor RraB [Idiomarina tyrosinivorans]|uniref:Ribonuclease E inhibitor RraB n=1 Tax=Idiomarina tyrosinivorans TaxID=1445662 RepID=A0A432ZG10_9GAMM|nr:ribonuclease E inhibitor RraB [Idiomarina tyrosinivorans]RUO76915.1 ribonuclease E inhibitor RraB [Idiomarina tyrosinivorans]